MVPDDAETARARAFYDFTYQQALKDYGYQWAINAGVHALLTGRVITAFGPHPEMTRAEFDKAMTD